MQLPSTHQTVQIFVGVLVGLGIGFAVHGNLPSISAALATVLQGNF